MTEPTETPPPTSAAAAAEAPPPPAPAPAAPHPAEVALAAAERERDDARELYRRALADMDNLRRRSQRERDEARRMAVAGVVEDFLPALDNLALGLAAARQHHPEAKSILDGLEMVLGQFGAILARQNVTAVDPTGAAFDPAEHEALGHVPHAEIPEGRVAVVTRRGYKLGDRLIRPASVLVSSGHPPAPAQDAASAPSDGPSAG